MITDYILPGYSTQIHCHQCGKIFLTREEMMEHWTKVCSIKNHRFQCSQCNRTYKNESDLKTHMKWTCVALGQEQRFKCPYCERYGKYVSNLYSHIRSNHKNSRVYIIDVLNGNAERRPTRSYM